MKRVAYYTFLALCLSGHSLLDVSRFLTDRPYREEIVFSLDHPELRRFWFSFPKQEREAREMTESFLNRMEPFLAIPSLKFFFVGPSTINFRKLIDKGYIV